ncbi:hypothetical protein CVT25_009513 [Psilocybe cyanescens]|uniref:NACHT domain-containing protein n=1 Tax=Psilocybe cyanescens TaxID=93625 RepID=A0A409X8H5_PSICY|nr:hypothetical protein CVT25_009513 [Psilocybe cyanescens]
MQAVTSQEFASTATTMFNTNAPLLITGGHFQQVVNNTDDKLMLDKGMHHFPGSFKHHVSLDATHDTAATTDPPRCHPKTRLVILRKLALWVCDLSPTSPIVLWIFGPAGAGKTAIGRSLAEQLAKEHHVAASFFFYRTDARRNDARFLIPTLAYQLVYRVPALQRDVVHYIQANPLIFNQSMETQLEHLIVSPILRSEEWKHQQVMIIDGLDECQNHDTQCKILTLIGSIALRLAGKLKILFLSRPEYHIEVTYQSLTSDLLFDQRFKTMDLKMDLSSFDDIRIFTNERFAIIKAKHPLRSKIPECWPSSDDVEKLIWRSSGNFIYPQTVMKYIETNYGRPQSRLEVILALTPTPDQPYGDMDNLYRHIMKNVRSDMKSVRKVLGVLLVLNTSPPDYQPSVPRNYRPWLSDTSAEHIEDLLSMMQGDIELLLIDLRSLITMEEKEINLEYEEEADFHDNNYIESVDSFESPLPKRYQIPRLLHRSFSDFLIDKTRSQEFWVDLVQARIYIAIGTARMALLQRTGRNSGRFLSMLDAHMNDKMFMHMMNDEDITSSEISVVPRALIGEYHFSTDIPRTHERNSTREWDWLMVFTSIRSTASGSVARALELITSAVLLPEQPVSDIRVHVIANGFFASFLAVGKKRYQMNEEKLQAATLFCLSYFSPSYNDIRNTVPNTSTKLRSHWRYMLDLLTRLLLVQVYGRGYEIEKRILSSQPPPGNDWTTELYCLPQKFEVRESVLRLRNDLESFLHDLQHPDDWALPTSTVQKFTYAAKSFIYVSDCDKSVQTDLGADPDVPCLICPTVKDFIQGTDTWSIEHLGALKAKQLRIAV